MRISADDFYLRARAALTAGRPVGVVISGDSMRPFLYHGDSVTLEPAAEYVVGDVVLARANEVVKAVGCKPTATADGGLIVLHYVAAMEGDRFTLMGAGNLYQREYCRREDIVGRVAEPALSRRRIRIWHALRPLRRILLHLV